MRPAPTHPLRSLLFLLGAAASPATAAQSTLFVDASAAPGGGGSTWGSAFVDLQDALDAARLDPSVAAIHVAAGVYRPDRGSRDSALSFELVDGLALLGGFPAGGGPPAGRDPLLHATVLSGDLLADDGPPDALGNIPGSGDNTRHVVYALNAGAGTLLDGFAIRAGVTAPRLGRDGSGANVLIEGGGPLIRHCRSEFSVAEDAGGGLAAFDAAVTLEHCTFANNRAFQRGAGAALLGVVAGRVESCVFENNVGGSGAGLAVSSEALLGGQGNDSSVRDCLFVGNGGVLGANAGGGLYLARARPTVRDCTFLGNLADGGGGAFVHEGSARFDTCLFRGNDVGGDGGGALSVSTFFGPGTGIPATEIVSCSMVGNNGGLVVVGLDAVLVNCTLADGRLPWLAAVETWPATFGQEANITLANCIVWGNVGLGLTLDERDHLTSNIGTTYIVLDSIVEDWAGALPGSALDLDPLFQDPTGPDGDPDTLEDNVYRLRMASPAVDAGDAAFLPPLHPFDVERLPRNADGNGDGLRRVDMGAYERQGSLRQQRAPNSSAAWPSQ